jgi:hypothetical protein
LPSAVVVLLLLSSGVADLTSEAAGSGRPRACPALSFLPLGPRSPGAVSLPPGPRSPSGLEAAQAGSDRPAQAIWQRAGQRRLARLCERLSSIQITLSSAPAEALAGAQALAAEWPDRVEPKQLVARALTRLGRHAEAWTLWASTTAASETSLTGTRALHDYALSAAMTGHDAQALSAYRAVVTRSASSADRAYRERVLIEASAAALRVDQTDTEEALGYLAAAADDRTTPLLATCAAGLARLANVLRPGALVDVPKIEASAAWAFLREIDTPSPARSSWPSLPAHELEALAALLIAPHDAERAAQLWQRYIAGLEGRGAAGRGAAERAHAMLPRLQRGTAP